MSSETHLDIRILKNIITIDCQNPYDPEDPIGFAFSQHVSGNAVGVGSHLNEPALQEIVERHCAAIAESLVAMDKELKGSIEKIKNEKDVRHKPLNLKAS